jgi:hypothetical protein
MSKRWFLVILAAAAVLALCAPFDAKLTPLMIRALSTQARTSIVGNSVLSHASRCDEDPRTLPQMLATDIGQPVLDLSFPGQSLDQAVNLAAIALRNPRTDVVVVPVSLFELFEWDDLSWRAYLMFRLINPAIVARSLTARLLGPEDTATSHPIESAFSYAGRDYPDYDLLKATYFTPENAAMPCPENDGVNRDFIAANYHHMYFDFPVASDAIRMLASLGEEARRRDRSLLLVLMPIDSDLIARLDVAGAAALHDTVAHAVDALASRGLHVLDLSASVANAHFADRWCACGHLQDSGRLEVARRIGQALTAADRTIAAH